MTSRRNYARRREQLRELLKTIRLEAGLTQVQLAARLNKRPQTFVSKMELGERRADVADVEEICDACGVDFLDFARRYREMR